MGGLWSNLNKNLMNTAQILSLCYYNYNSIIITEAIANVSNVLTGSADISELGYTRTEDLNSKGFTHKDHAR